MELIKDLKTSVRLPSVTVFSIMMVYSLVEIFLFFFTGSFLTPKEIMYTILLTWLPFILGNKVSTKTFENNEVVILVILTIFIALAGVTLKSNELAFEFPEMCYFIALTLSFLWMLVDFKNFNRIREQRKKEKEKNKTGSEYEGYEDGMEMDE